MSDLFAELDDPEGSIIAIHIGNTSNLNEKLKEIRIFIYLYSLGTTKAVKQKSRKINLPTMIGLKPFFYF